MSASERLKALDAETTQRVISSMHYYFGPNARTAVSKESADACVAATRVLRALPQIVAVVEAATGCAATGFAHYGYKAQLQESLAALEEALSYDNIPGAGQRGC